MCIPVFNKGQFFPFSLIEFVFDWIHLNWFVFCSNMHVRTKIALGNHSTKKMVKMFKLCHSKGNRKHAIKDHHSFFILSPCHLHLLQELQHRLIPAQFKWSSSKKFWAKSSFEKFKRTQGSSLQLKLCLAIFLPPPYCDNH